MPSTPPEPREPPARGEPAAPAPPALPRAAAPVAVLALGVAAYANSFGVPFQFDDGSLIVGNPALAGVGPFLASAPGARRVVALFTFALNGSLGGPAVFGYHALNLAIHLASALVLYALTAFACRAVAEPGSALERRAPAAALVAAALFVAHPLQTQAVTYVIQRMASLGALLYLAAVLAYVRSATGAAGARRAIARGVALVLAALAIFTKENAVTIPAALAIVELTLLSGSARARAERLAPFAALSVASLLVLAPGAAAREAASGFASVAPDGATLPAWAAYAITQPAAILSYLRLLAVPVGQSVDHDLLVPASALAPSVLVPAALLALLLGGVTWAAWRARARGGGRLALLAVGWFVVTIAVESSVIPLADLVVEHRVYLPSAGIFLALGAAVALGLDRLSPRARPVAWAGVAAVALLLAGATFARNQVWRDPLALWSDAMAKAPERSRPHIFVAQALMARGEAGRAIPLLERATGLRPRTPLAHLNLAVAYMEEGRLAEAERAARTAIATASAPVPGANVVLGRVLLRMGRVQEACAAFEAELAAAPRDREARTNLVVCSLAAGDPRGALAQAAQLDAEGAADARLLFNLALAAGGTGDAARATDAYRRFLAVAGPELAPQREAARRWLAERGAASAAAAP